jgi:hypothetical protein
MLLRHEDLSLFLSGAGKGLLADELPEIFLLPEQVKLFLLDARPPLSPDDAPKELLRAEGIFSVRCELEAGEYEGSLDDVAQIFFIAEKIPLLFRCERAPRALNQLPQVIIVSEGAAI